MAPQSDVVVTYLQMSREAHRPAAPSPHDGVFIVRVVHPPVSWYRYLYDAVGRNWHWSRRKLWSDEKLAEEIHDPDVELHVLMVQGVPAGFAQLDFRTPPEVELVQFGLTADFLGRDLGKYFLDHMVDEVWTRPVTRFWLHTCSLDHPAAIPNYLRAGFVRYHQEIEPRSAELSVE